MDSCTRQTLKALFKGIAVINEFYENRDIYDIEASDTSNYNIHDVFTLKEMNNL